MRVNSKPDLKTMEYRDDDEFGSCSSTGEGEDDHGRTILHFDVDCFYAQVEMLNDPSLKEKPLGIQQKNIVVTCNYVARKRGVGKCQYIAEAKKTCPDLVLVNGEDLAQYRRVSMNVYNSLVRETQSEVERLGMDENWVDVTQMVETRMREGETLEKEGIGHCVGLACARPGCGCDKRLVTGSVIARELRDLIRREHGLTVSAGISYNKLLAKLGGSLHKPNDQTVLGHGGVNTVLNPERRVTSIPGVGRKMGQMLESGGVTTVAQLREASTSLLASAGIPEDSARLVQGLARGWDQTKVKMSGKVASIGLEDRFMGIHDRQGVRDKLVWLVDRLEQLVIEDGRRATIFRVTIRDYIKDKMIKKFHKESRQSKVAPRLFLLNGGVMRQSAKTELVDIGLSLVGKMLNMSTQFHITLLGVCLSDFLDQVETKSSIKRFFSPTKCDAEKVKISSEKNIMSQEQAKDEGGVKKRKLDFTTEDSDENVEKLLECPRDYDQSVWSSLPSSIQKEIISDNRIQATVEDNINMEPEQISLKAESDRASECPQGIDSEIFGQLPREIQLEILNNEKTQSSTVRPKKSKVNKIDNYFSVKSKGK